MRCIDISARIVDIGVLPPLEIPNVLCVQDTWVNDMFSMGIEDLPPITMDIFFPESFRNPEIHAKKSFWSMRRIVDSIKIEGFVRPGSRDREPRNPEEVVFSLMAHLARLEAMHDFQIV